MPKFQVDKTLIRDLGQLLDESNLTEIEICEGNKSVRVSRAATHTVAPAVAAPAAAPVATNPAGTAPESAAPSADDPGAIPSPMVGTTYLSPQPGAAPFIKPGDQVTEGQTLLIIEAMKVMNQIPAPRFGVVKTICVADAQPVEFGEVLLILE
jgi:acetyl-CoA carboxylase biotin carboxyl carrier protein